MRTFFKRLTSTVILLAILCGVLFAPVPYSSCLFHFCAAFLSFFAVYEFGKILLASDHKFELKTTATFVSASVLLFSVLFDFSDGGLLEAVFWLAIVFFAYVIHAWTMFLLSKNEEVNMQGIFASAFAYFMFVVPFCCIVGIYFAFPQKYHLALVFLLIVTKIGDTAAYVFGSLANYFMRNRGGNHKMIPSISPGKSYEGAVAGLIFTVLASCLIGYYLGIGFWYLIVFGIILFFGCMAGDLAESALKRTCKIKDSGTILPGIGGVLDLVDSLMVTSPLFLLLLVALMFLA